LVLASTGATGHFAGARFAISLADVSVATDLIGSDVAVALLGALVPVCLRTEQLHVDWIAADGIAAEVVDLKVLRDLAERQPPGDSVGGTTDAMPV
jgi:hypothetical protein